jgi:hypothetical protein
MPKKVAPKKKTSVKKTVKKKDPPTPQSNTMKDSWFTKVLKFFRLK